MIQLPKADEVAGYFTRLLRREVAAQELPARTALDMACVGGYHIGNGIEVGRCGADLVLAAYSGAALSLIPPDAAEESIRRGQLDDNLRENFAEILNVVTRLLLSPKAVRVALLGTSPAQTWPAAPAGQRVQFLVDIDGYGKGVLAFERSVPAP